MGAWDAVRYGWGVVYWLTIEGIPVVFTERGLGLPLPSGFDSEDGSLVIDDSSEIGSEVDRRRGVSAGLSLGFRLLDTAAVRDFIRKPSHTAELSLDATAIANIIRVESTAGWPAAGRFWLGHELISYTGTTATTFTGCARGVAGLAYKHSTVSIGNVATDRPRWWRGRLVTLYATPIDPAGIPSGVTLATDAVEVWRGKVSDGPIRGGSWWDFQADALERILDRPLAAKISGVVVPASTVYLASPQAGVAIDVQAFSAAGALLFTYQFNFKPFASVAANTYFSGEEMRERISTAWAAAVTAQQAGAVFGPLKWQPKQIEGGKAGKAVQGFLPAIEYAANANVRSLRHGIALNSTQTIVYTEQYTFGTAGLPAQTFAFSGFSLTADNPYDQPNAMPQAWQGITVQLDSGIDSMVPDKGLLKIAPPEGGAFVAKYGAKESGPAGVIFKQVKQIYGQSYFVGTLIDSLIGGQVEVIFADEGNPDGCALRLLHSSGTGLRSAAWDMLNEGQGYGLPAAYVDADSFAGTLGAGACGQLGVRVSPAGASFVDVFGGLLALSSLAIASRQASDGKLKLAAVRTSAIGGEFYTTIADADLLSLSDQAVTAQSKLTPLNRITVTQAPYGVTWSADGVVSGEDEKDQPKKIYNDIPAILALGEEGLDASIPCVDNAQLGEFAYPLAVSTFAADQTSQAIQLMVPPWVKAEVGDLVQLNLTHPSLWDYATATPGYVGLGRVLGRTIEPRTMRCKLTLLINSSIKTLSLSPSAPVSAWVGAANAPTSIDIGLEYLSRMQAAVSTGNIWLVHYKPGQTETPNTKFQVSAAASVGGLCRLTVVNGTWAGGTLSTAERSSITWPATANANDFQKQFAHDGDLSAWS